MSHSKILLRALPNVEFVHGYPGIPASPQRPQATIRGTIEVRLGSQPAKVKWIKVDFRKIETIPGGSNGEEFMDFVGQSPMTVWQAQGEEETISSKDFPFSIRVPETIPPSVALGRGAGIKYEVVATICMRGKKGLFRREASTTASHAVPVVMDKHELHSTWPVYAQPESRQVSSDGLTLVVNRSNTCFAPADRLVVMATLKSDHLSPVVLRGFEFSLRETIIYRSGPQSHGKKHGPQVHTTILGEQKVPVSMTLYGGTQHKAELGCIVPGNHTTSSVNSGRHIDIGYTMNIKAILDKEKPVSMDLPVTITNWPRHVSVDMIRRIGIAPNLTLTSHPQGGPGIPAMTQPTDFRPGLGHPLSPSAGSHPLSPTSRGYQGVPPGALVSGPPGSPVPGTTNGNNLYSPGLFGTSSQVPPRPMGSGAQQILDATPNQNPSLGSPSKHPSSANAEKTTFATSSDPSVPNPHGGLPSEFGYRKPDVPLTAASRQSQNYDPYDSGVIDVTHRPGSIANYAASPVQTTGSESSVVGVNKSPQIGQGNSIRGLSGPSSSIRRPRAMSRTLQIVNATEDIIPEDDSPVKEALEPIEDRPNSPKQSSQAGSPPASPPVSPPVSQAPSHTPWPTAEEEKQRLFDRAKARAEKVQAQARINAVAGGSAQTSSSPHSNGRGSPSSIERSIISERPRTASPTSSQLSWPTAEDEKLRLYEQATANVRRTQGMVPATQPPPSNGHVARLTHNRTASTNSSQDSTKRPYMTNSPPTISAGAALYSHALASMKSPVMATSTLPQASSSTARVPTSHIASSSNVSSSIKTYPTAKGDNVGNQTHNAGMAIEQTRKEDVPQDSPIAYDALFPPTSSSIASPSAQGIQSPQLSEKEMLRRAYDAHDAAVAANQPALPAPNVLAMSNGTRNSTRMTPPPTSPREPLSEKEVFRRAFEARDAAMMRSGQVPPPAPMPSNPPSRQSSVSVRPPPPGPIPSHPPSRQPSVSVGSSTTSHVEPPQRTQLTEKERMRLAFESRDRALASQQTTSPPEYDIPPPTFPIAIPAPPPLDMSDSGTLTAAQEKAQLKARYAQEDAGLSLKPDEPTFPAPQPGPVEHASSPTGESHKSESSEGFLRRDPTISAGKKRASQMVTPPPPSPPPPPPPLLPRPPPEYIEETKLEDMKNNLSPTVNLPIDFSAPLDLGFSPFGSEQGTSSSTLPEVHSG